MQEDHWDLKVRINGQHTFFLHQKAVCAFSGKLRKMVRAKQERERSRMGCTNLKITDFPGGPSGFELIVRFCYNNGSISMNPSNVSILHCSASFLEMTEECSIGNILSQTEKFLDGIFYWDWKDIISSLKSCESFLSSAESSGLLRKLVSSLFPKISANSGVPLESTISLASSSSSSSSPDTSGFRFSSSTKTPDTARHCFAREWWFDDLTTLHPVIIEHIVKRLKAYGGDNKNLVLTRFLLHYIKTAVRRRGDNDLGMYTGLADTAVHGVASAGRTAFSCKMLFWVRRVVWRLGLSRECRGKLERLMGLVIDQASLDDLLVSGNGAVYDVNLVLRLVGVFLSAEEGGVPLQRMKKVGRLVDKYLREVSPDPGLKAAKFEELAKILPDSARDCFDGVYRALEIYLESHRKLTFEDRSRLCQCLNYEKITLEACKDLAKNPWIPPREAVQALISQKSKLTVNHAFESPISSKTSRATCHHREPKEGDAASMATSDLYYERGLIFSMQTMQGKVVGLERSCKVIRDQMQKMVKNKILINSPSYLGNKAMPRLC